MKRWLCLMAVGLSILPTAGCAAGMHGMHGMHGSPQHGATTIVKEVRNERVTATLTVPPFVLNRESVIEIAVRHTQTNEPLVDAGVAVTVRGLGDSNRSTHMGHSRHTVISRRTARAWRSGRRHLGRIARHTPSAVPGRMRSTWR